MIPCRDTDDVVDTARLLSEQPLPAGRRVGVVTNAGGLGVIGADLAADLGLDVPELSPDLQARILALAPGAAGAGNPVDAGAGAEAPALGAIVEAVLGSGEVDAVLVPLVATGLASGAASGAVLAAAQARHPGVTLVVVPMGGFDLGDSDALTVFASLQGALASLARAAAYRAWRDASQPTPAEPAAPAVPGPGARAEATRLLAAAAAAGAEPAPTWVGAVDARDLLAPYGLRVSGERATTAQEAVEVATRLGYPVVVKADSAEVVHKTERGLVHLGLRSAEQVRAAVRAIQQELGDHGAVVVQRQGAGLEVALGLVRDPGLGPLVMVAAGGVATEVWADRVFLVPPVTAVDAEQALRRLRLWPLLAGFRGAPGSDVVALTRLVVAVGRLALDVPEVAELDLNPVLVDAEGCTVVDLALRLESRSEDELLRLSELRQLRAAR